MVQSDNDIVDPDDHIVVAVVDDGVDDPVGEVHDNDLAHALVLLVRMGMDLGNVEDMNFLLLMMNLNRSLANLNHQRYV